jgi:pyruvate dehydrogenase complex dehydrogenase (E1) component
MSTATTHRESRSSETADRASSGTSPAYHAIQYLFGRQSREQLENFRALGGAQAYPSCNKDKDDVDFPTGSVGLGVGLTAFAALAEDYLVNKNLISADQTGRMVALLGDAELDEGNIHEALTEGCKHDLRDVWWVVVKDSPTRDTSRGTVAEQCVVAFPQVRVAGHCGALIRLDMPYHCGRKHLSIVALRRAAWSAGFETSRHR